MHSGGRPPVLIDECLPAPQFRAFLESRGYEVLTVGAFLASGSTDQEVLAGAADIGAVIITTDTDFERILAKAHGHKGRLRKAGRIVIRCDHSKAFSRFQARIDDVEREYEEAQREGRPFFVAISETRFSVEK